MQYLSRDVNPEDVPPPMLILAAIAAFFVYGLIASMLGTIMPDLSRHFDLTPRQNGWIATAQAIGLILASLLVGPLLDYEGKKIGLVLGLALIVVALFALPRCRSMRVLWLLFLLLGMGGGTVVTGASALASDISPLHRGASLNLTNLFFGVGGLLTPFLAANVFSHNWIRLCYAVATLSGLTLVVEAMTRMPGPSGTHYSMHAAAGVLTTPLLLLLGVFLFLYTACEGGVWNWLPRFLIVRGISKSKALNILSFGFALGLLLGRAGASIVLLHVSAVNVGLASAGGMTILAFLMLRAKKAAMAAVWVFCAGLCMAPIFPITVALVGDHFHAMTSTAMGFVITCGWIGLAVSSPAIGAIAGDEPERLGKALLVIPGSAALMVGINLAIRLVLR
jgi:fucose permease